MRLTLPFEAHNSDADWSLEEILRVNRSKRRAELFQERKSWRDRKIFGDNITFVPSRDPDSTKESLDILVNMYAKDGTISVSYEIDVHSGSRRDEKLRVWLPELEWWEDDAKNAAELLRSHNIDVLIQSELPEQARGLCDMLLCSSVVVVSQPGMHSWERYQLPLPVLLGCPTIQIIPSMYYSTLHVPGIVTLAQTANDIGYHLGENLLSDCGQGSLGPKHRNSNFDLETLRSHLLMQVEATRISKAVTESKENSLH